MVDQYFLLCFVLLFVCFCFVLICPLPVPSSCACLYLLRSSHSSLRVSTVTGAGAGCAALRGSRWLPGLGTSARGLAGMGWGVHVACLSSHRLASPHPTPPRTNSLGQLSDPSPHGTPLCAYVSMATHYHCRIKGSND